MTCKKLALALLLILPASTAFAQPGLSVVPQGLQNGDWVWRVDLTPDLILAPTGTPLAVELGFRLTGSPLLSVTNINPSEFDTPNPGVPIFGWEQYSDTNADGIIDSTPPTQDEPVGLQMNAATSEIFVAYGSIDFQTPGAKPFLEIVAKGPANGGAPISNIEWLGAYFDNGRIAQLVGPFTAANFDIFSGSASQAIPEPATAAMLAIGVFAAMQAFDRRNRRKASILG
jgi:hypothetical protein